MNAVHSLSNERNLSTGGGPGGRKIYSFAPGAKNPRYASGPGTPIVQLNQSLVIHYRQSDTAGFEPGTSSLFSY
jgi:hypothetical protein